MNTQFERSANATDEWYTPKEIIDELGVFGCFGLTSITRTPYS